jgi:hypothetical protein
MLELEKNNPKEFWRLIGKVGVGGERSGIPLEVITEDGQISTDIDDILQCWQDGFEKILNPLDNNHLNMAVQHFLDNDELDVTSQNGLIWI